LRSASQSLGNSLGGKSGTDSLQKEDFLKLMMTQLTNQDPMNPMDSQGMMQQVSQMGSMEQLMNINGELGKLNAMQSDLAQSNAFSFLDKDVTVKGGSAQVSRGSAPAMQFSLPHEAEQVSVAISGADGAAVRSLDLGGRGAGSQTVTWDGQNDDGEVVPDGTYHYAVSAKGPDGLDIPVELYVRGKVSGVEFKNGRHFVKVNGEPVDVRDIVAVSNESQHLFGNRALRPLRDTLGTAAPVIKPDLSPLKEDE
jgi:flagellar basal-body rod modification protein FlgD